MPLILPVGFTGAEAFLVAVVHGLPEQVCAILIRLVVTAATIVTIPRSRIVIRITLVVMLAVSETSFAADVHVLSSLPESGTASCDFVAVIPRFAAALDPVPDLRVDDIESRAFAAAQ